MLGRAHLLMSKGIVEFSVEIADQVSISWKERSCKSII